MNLSLKNRISVFTYILLFVFSTTISFTNTYAAQGVPSTLSYQGKLTDSGGNPLGGGGTSYYFKFSIWDNATVGSGTKLWPTASPTATQLTVRQGSFSVDIGGDTYPDVLNYDFNTNSKIYLQVEVSADGVNFETLNPRSPIAATAFSQVANSINGTADSSFGTTTPFTNTLISALSTSVNKAVMTIKGMVGQVASLFNIQDSSGNTLFTVTPSGNVGVGTSTPSTKLHVLSDTGISFSHPNDMSRMAYLRPLNQYTTELTSVGFSGTAIRLDANFLSLRTGSSDRLYINSSGNVGIGTTTPNATLNILSSSASDTPGSSLILSLDAAADKKVGLRYSSNQQTLIMDSMIGGAWGTSPIMSFGRNSGNVAIGTSSTASLGSYSRALTIAVGSSPQTAGLELQGNRGAGSSLVAGLNFYNISNNIASIQANTGSAINSGTLAFNIASGGVLSESMRIDSSGNVGIGTTTPSAKLDVWGNLKVGTSSTPALFVDTANKRVGIGVAPSTQSGLVVKADMNSTIGLQVQRSDSTAVLFQIDNATPDFSGKLSLNTASTNKIVLNANSSQYTYFNAGNVGIGTSTPGSKLSIVGGDIRIANELQGLFFETGSNGFYSQYNETYWIANSAERGRFTTNGLINSGYYAFGSSARVSNPDAVISRYSANNILISSDGSTGSANLLVNGNVGIGTTTPSAKLDVWGNLKVGTSSTPALFVDTAKKKIGIGTENPDNLLHIDGTLNTGILLTNNTQAPDRANYYINVGNGGAYNAFNISEKYDGVLYGHIQAYAKSLYFGGFANATSLSSVTILNDQAKSRLLEIRSGNISSSPVFTVLNNGNVGIGTTTPSQKLSVVGNAQFTGVTSGTYGFDLNLTADGTLTTSASDRNLKENIMLLDATSTLDKLMQLRPSEFDWKSNKSHDIGLIAQEVEQIFPELVFTNPTDGYKGVNYSRFITLLISSVQELTKKVTGFAKEFRTEKLCVGDTCITEAQLKVLLQNQNVTYTAPTTVIISDNENTNATTTEVTSTSTGEVVSDTTNETVVEDNAPEAPAVTEQIIDTATTSTE